MLKFYDVDFIYVVYWVFLCRVVDFDGLRYYMDFLCVGIVKVDIFERLCILGEVKGNKILFEVLDVYFCKGKIFCMFFMWLFISIFLIWNEFVGKV